MNPEDDFDTKACKLYLEYLKCIIEYIDEVQYEKND